MALACPGAEGGPSVAAQRSLSAACRRRRQLAAPNGRQDPGQGDRAGTGGDEEHWELPEPHQDDGRLFNRESAGGIKTLEALGALKLLSGGSASLAAVDDLHQATGRGLNLVVGQKHNATVGGDMEERIMGMRQSVTSEN